MQNTDVVVRADDDPRIDPEPVAIVPKVLDKAAYDQLYLQHPHVTSHRQWLRQQNYQRFCDKVHAAPQTKQYMDVVTAGAMDTHYTSLTQEEYDRAWYEFHSEARKVLIFSTLHNVYRGYNSPADVNWVSTQRILLGIDQDMGGESQSQSTGLTSTQILPLNFSGNLSTCWLTRARNWLVDQFDI